MAPIQRHANNARSNGDTNDEAMEVDLPPSTMAAQLISNFPSNNQTGTGEDVLERLAQEVSGMELVIAETNNDSVKLEYQHKLIYLFSRTILEKLDGKTPIDVTVFLSHASTAIDLIRNAIKDYPAVLHFVLPPGIQFEGRGQEPLWIWLFPRMLAMLGRKELACLTEKIKDFFYECFQVVSRSPRLWNLNFSFFSYLKECIATTLHHLAPSRTLCSTKIEITLPTNQDDLSKSFFGSSEVSSSELHHCSYSITNSLEGFSHATESLLMLVDICMEAASSFDATPAFQDYVAWIFESFCTLHNIYQDWQANPILYKDCLDPDKRSFCSLYAFLSSLRDLLSSSLLRKGYTILSILCANVLPEQNQSIQLDIRKCFLQLASICQRHESMRRLVSLHLVPGIKSALEDKTVPDWSEKDFQNSATILCKICDDEGIKGSQVSITSDFENDELSAEFDRLGLENLQALATNGGMAIEPPTKRRKANEESSILGEITANLYELLGSQRTTNIDGLHQFAVERFAALDNGNRCKVFEYLGQVVCAASGHLTTVRVGGKTKDMKCSLCESGSLPTFVARDETTFTRVIHEAILTLTKLIQSADFKTCRKPRVLAMFALRTFAVHYDKLEFLSLNGSPLGQWCLSSLRSSTRELRIAAGRTLSTFSRGESTPNSLTRANRQVAMSHLREISELSSTYLHESAILAWGQLGRNSQDEELCLVLLSLVTYLGHSNPIVSSASYNEIRNLAESVGMTVQHLFSPFWGAVAIRTVRDLVARPQSVQLLSELLGVAVSDFLIMTQSHTLPYLVLERKIDVINRIAAATKEDNFQLLMQSQNLVAILALLLQQNVPEMETFTMSLLKSVSKGFDSQDFAPILHIEPCEQALHLLNAAAEADDSKKSRIRFGLQYLAEQTTGENNRKSNNVLSDFFDYHILGLVARLSYIVNDAPGKEGANRTITEKRRCVKTAEELIKMAKTNTRLARPQLCAILQSAFSQKDLQSAAFSAWDAMLRNMDDQDVEDMLESTFTTIIQRWDTFDKPTRVKAEAALQYLVKERPRLVRIKLVNLPSLSRIPDLADVEIKVQGLRAKTDQANMFAIFSRRISHENSGVVSQALAELIRYLPEHQGFLQTSAASEQPDVVVSQLVRSILDSCVKFNGPNEQIPILAAKCLGLIGCLDPNRIESIRAPRNMVVVYNFEDPSETTDFVLFALEEAILPVFLSTTDSQLQGFLSYSMQELLRYTKFSAQVPPALNVPVSQHHGVVQKWDALKEDVRAQLTPFLSSRYSLAEIAPIEYRYPIFQPGNAVQFLFSTWQRHFVHSLLRKHNCESTNFIFPKLLRAVRPKETSIASFLLPYVVLYVMVVGSDENRHNIAQEMLSILQYEPSAKLREEVKLCVEAVFRALDYLARWIHERQIKANQSRGQDSAEQDIAKITDLLNMIPPEIISARAVECKSYSRALFYWEQHIRNARQANISLVEDTALLERLQDIYQHIDEPDGIEGISAHLQVVDINQQILGHRKAGRWTAAQSWYEIQLTETPDDFDAQLNLLTCLKESGQLDVLLNYVEGMHAVDTKVPLMTSSQAMDSSFMLDLKKKIESQKTVQSKLLAFATEASWLTGKWSALEKYTSMKAEATVENFNVNIGLALLDLRKSDMEAFKSRLSTLRGQIARSMSDASTSSFSACHDDLLKLHVLTELEMIAGTEDPGKVSTRTEIHEELGRRLDIIGSYLQDKQYLLGIRRAAMQVSSLEFDKGDIASTWLVTARLARKGDAMQQSFNAVLHAAQLGDDSATIEHARLLWKEGQHRKAIQSLQGAIAGNVFMSHNRSMQATSIATTDTEIKNQQNLLVARAHLLLAKWLDSAGQTNALALRSQYQLAAKTHLTWEKGHYYLGRHYNKLLKAEQELPYELQKDEYVSGEMAKLVIESYLRSMLYGTKYLHQTMPRVLTLWLDLGNPVKISIDSRMGPSKEAISKMEDLRRKNMEKLHARWAKYVGKLPAYMFYTALPQIVARIAHPNTEVFRWLQTMVTRVIEKYPQQALWSLLAVCASTQSDRRSRGATILQQVRGLKKNATEYEMKLIIKKGERICEQLLLACNAGEFQGNRTIFASLTRDLGFNAKICLPSLLAVPVQSVLTGTLPTVTEDPMRHEAFSRDVICIDAFDEEVMILSSLQKPRKLTARGSDGRSYGLMCKPKDDLRKDQRLMEFNSMINRSLKRDAESSRRQLYIKTYAVTPLNEECGLIEWVDGLKTLRDILLGLYKPLGITPNYREIEQFCEEAIKSEDKLSFFTDKVLGRFPPIFHRWFVQQFPEPSTWFAARLRYTRSCAVMSMVGTILGLGDRHGENILFEEGSGGTFHVDFNCLFDKGLTFVKPERVPFRLTHNMIDAMGMYGYDGPFRKSAELTLKLLRQNEETLMTILEAFIYDPTLDLLNKKPDKKKRDGAYSIPQTAQGVLDSIQRKIRGLLAGESVPLGVEGQVDELVKLATNQTYLAGFGVGDFVPNQHCRGHVTNIPPKSTLRKRIAILRCDAGVETNL